MFDYRLDFQKPFEYLEDLKDCEFDQSWQYRIYIFLKTWAYDELIIFRLTIGYGIREHLSGISLSLY